MLNRLRQEPSDCIVGPSTRSPLVPLGSQRSMTAPCARYMNATRFGGMPAAHARRIAAGIIDSSSGNPKATPAPRSSVLRERCFFVR